MWRAFSSDEALGQSLPTAGSAVRRHVDIPDAHQCASKLLKMNGPVEPGRNIQHTHLNVESLVTRMESYHPSPASSF